MAHTVMALASCFASFLEGGEGKTFAEAVCSPAPSGHSETTKQSGALQAEGDLS